MTRNPREQAQAIRSALLAAYSQALNNPEKVHTPTAGQRGAVIGILNKITGGDDNRKLLLGWLFASGDVFDRVSTKTLNDAQWSALYAWCDFMKDEERIIWKPKDTFSQECLACLSAAMADYIQIPYLDRDDLPEPPDIVSVAVELGGEIVSTEKVGIKVDDSAFEREKDLPEVNIPDKSEFKSEIFNKPEEKVIRQVFQKKPKLYNPF